MSRLTRSSLLSLAGLLVLAACKGDDTDTDGDGPFELSGACPMAADQGGFLIQGGDPGGVQGGVADGVVPISVLEQVGEQGPCRLLKQLNPVCEPACDANETCDLDGTCVAYPRKQDLGIVTVTGLVQPVEMEPVFPGNTYFDTSLPDPPYVEGETIVLHVPDPPFGPLELYGVGLSPHEALDAEWKIDPGSDLEVRWTPPGDPEARSEVTLRVFIDQHGVSPASLHCTFDDTGTGVVPAALLEQLVEVGVTGFPSGSLERRTADRADLPDGGCMDLVVSAPARVPVDVVGFTPCVSTDDCPDGQTCNLELQICEPAS